MLESGYWWQHALQDALDAQDTVERKTKLVRLVILGRLVSSSEIDRKEEDALFDTLDALRALDWERLSTPVHLESVGSSLARQ
jgi:hypothetical protein